MPRYKKFCFTLNNYTDQEILELEDIYNSHLQYLAYGKEIAPQTNTPHLQGYIITKKETSKKDIIDLLPSRVHVEVMRGNIEQNENYISKDGDVTVYGVPQVIVPTIEQVVELIRPVEPRVFTSMDSTDLEDQIFEHKRKLYRMVLKQCPVQFIRHGKGIKSYIDELYYYRPKSDKYAPLKGKFWSPDFTYLDGYFTITFN